MEWRSSDFNEARDNKDCTENNKSFYACATYIQKKGEKKWFNLVVSRNES